MDTQTTTDVETQNETQKEEEQLLRKVANGDRIAFAELTRRYEGLIYTVIHRVLNNAEDARDTTQEVLWQIWKKAATYAPAKGKARTWIVTMARNRAIDRIRSNGRQARLVEAISLEPAPHEQTSEDPGTALQSMERKEVVQQAILELTDKQKEVIELAYFAEMTQVEIAERLGEPLGTVKARIRRSVKRLHGIVGDRLVK